MRKIKLSLVLLISSLFAYGCSPDSPSGDSSSALKSYPGELTKAEYDALTDEQKYRAANKFMSAIFKGVPVDEFFDISGGMQALKLKSGDGFFNNTKVAMVNELTQQEREDLSVVISGYDDVGTDNDVDGIFDIDIGEAGDDPWPKELAMARMSEYPVSKDMFDHWVAYILSNTILFSPAEEIDSASMRDVQKVYNKLVDDLRADKSIREIIARHQHSQENWRRFRSPEDNTREMIEIYLGLFDRDEDVPRASIACQDLYLSDEANGYELLSTGFFNTEPQYVLGTFVTSCTDFYSVVANHPLVIPRMAAVIVDYMLGLNIDVDPELATENRLNMIELVLSGNPETFQDIFKTILFSKEFLLNSERPMSFEENFFGSAKRLDWEANPNTLREITSDSNMMSVKQMGWPSMSNKLGRLGGVPFDSLSFANYHRALRESLYLDGDNSNLRSCGGSGCTSCDNGRCQWKFGLGAVEKSAPTEPAAGASPQQVVRYNYLKANFDRYEARRERVQQLSPGDYIDYIFMSSLQRKSTVTEKADLMALIGDGSLLTSISSSSGFLDVDADDNQIIRDGRHDDVAQVVLDYASRLHESYYFLKIN